MNTFIEDILTRIQDLLELAPPVGCHVMADECLKLCCPHRKMDSQLGLQMNA